MTFSQMLERFIILKSAEPVGFDQSNLCRLIEREGITEHAYWTEFKALRARLDSACPMAEEQHPTPVRFK